MNDTKKLREEYKNTLVSRRELEFKYGVSQFYVYSRTKDIKKSILGKHLGVKSNNRSLSKDIIEKIIVRIEAGDILQKDIAKEFNTTPATISQIKTGKIYAT